MNKPQTLDDFKKLLSNMDHRERFVFDSTQKWPLEIYATRTDEGYGSMNIQVQFQFTDNKQTTNKLLKLWHESYYQQIYDLLK